MTPTYPGHPVGIRPAITIDSETPHGGVKLTARVLVDGTIEFTDPDDSDDVVGRLSAEGAEALTEAPVGCTVPSTGNGLIDHARATRQRWEESRIKDAPVADGPGTDG